MGKAVVGRMSRSRRWRGREPCISLSAVGIPRFTRSTVTITQPRARHCRVTLARLHETSWLPLERLTSVDGLPCTTVARCVFDLAGDPPTWARGRDRALEVHASLARDFNNALADQGLTVDNMAAVVAGLGRRGRSGTAQMRRLLREFGSDYVSTREQPRIDVPRARAVGRVARARPPGVGGLSRGNRSRRLPLPRGQVVIEVEGGPWPTVLSTEIATPVVIFGFVLKAGRSVECAGDTSEAATNRSI